MAILLDQVPIDITHIGKRRQTKLLIVNSLSPSALWEDQGGNSKVTSQPASSGLLGVNATRRSFLAALECELPDRRRFASQAEARIACFSFIQGWYNPVRLQSALGFRSPLAYEAAMSEVTAES